MGSDANKAWVPGGETSAGFEGTSVNQAVNLSQALLEGDCNCPNHRPELRERSPGKNQDRTGRGQAHHPMGLGSNQRSELEPLG